MPDDRRPRIINVTRKPTKCPECGERVVDIVYGTGDMTEIDFMFNYRKEAIMGGNNIPRRPPDMVLLVWMQAVSESESRRNRCSCESKNAKRHP